MATDKFYLHAHRHHNILCTTYRLAQSVLDHEPLDDFQPRFEYCLSTVQKYESLLKSKFLVFEIDEQHNYLSIIRKFILSLLYNTKFQYENPDEINHFMLEFEFNEVTKRMNIIIQYCL